MNRNCEPKMWTQTRNASLNMNMTTARHLFVTQQNITTRHDMSQTCHIRHIVMPDDQIIKK